MGSTVAKEMKKNMEENQKSMIQAQKELMLKQRQIQIAIEFARGKERFYWYSAFYFGAATACFVALHKGKKQLVIPLYPLTFMFLYQFDLYYLNKQNRIRKIAEQIIAEEPERFLLPQGNVLISQKDYDKIFEKVPENKF